jgi:hypothetical protein
MSDRHPAAKQRASLLRFAAALGSRASALRPDECGDPSVIGKKGHVYAVCGMVGEPSKAGFQLCVSAASTTAWTYAKRALAFAHLTNDGDEEGMFFLDRLPTKVEANAIRRYLGIPQRRVLSPRQRERLAAYSFPARGAGAQGQALAKKTASDVPDESLGLPTP